MEGAWCCPWGSDSAEDPLSHTGMKLFSSHHKSMRSHQNRGEGDEPLSSGLQRFWGREQSAELDLGYMSPLTTLSPAVCSSLLDGWFALSLNFLQQACSLSWTLLGKGLQKCLRAQGDGGVIAMDWRGTATREALT